MPLARLDAPHRSCSGTRPDGGDADDGGRLDVGDGLVLTYAPRGLQVDVRVRCIVMHQVRGFADHGFSVVVSYDLTLSAGLGLRTSVAPAWGGDARSGADALWAADAIRQAGYVEPAGDPARRASRLRTAERGAAGRHTAAQGDDVYARASLGVAAVLPHTDLDARCQRHPPTDGKSPHARGQPVITWMIHSRVGPSPARAGNPSTPTAIRRKCYSRVDVTGLGHGASTTPPRGDRPLRVEPVLHRSTMQHMTPRRTPKPPDRKPSAMKPTARYRLTPEWRPRLAERVEGDGTTMAPFLERTLTRDLAIDRQEPVRTSVRGAVVKADGCVVWLNGAFGVGKTTVGLALAAGLPDARIVDPEQIGRRLRQALPVVLRTSDFQDMPSWRRQTVTTIEGLLRDRAGPLVVPMTVVNPAYFDETVGLLRRSGIAVHHFSLVASPKTIRRRLLRRLSPPWATWWALRRVDRCTSALRSPLFATHVETDNRSVADVVAAIRSAARTGS